MTERELLVHDIEFYLISEHVEKMSGNYNTNRTLTREEVNTLLSRAVRYLIDNKGPNDTQTTRTMGKSWQNGLQRD